MASPRSSPRCIIVKLVAALSTYILVMIRAGCAKQYIVGGPGGWVVGDDLQTWASQYTFYVGDNLYFEYVYPQSSVLLVTEEDYKECDTNTPVAADGGLGDMVMTLLSAQTYFFISGHADQCNQGLRLQIPVLDLPAAGGLQPGVTSSSPFSNNPSNNIPSDPVILTPPGSINTPYSTFRPNAASPSSFTTSFTLFCLALALAFTHLLTL